MENDSILDSPINFRNKTFVSVRTKILKSIEKNLKQSTVKTCSRKPAISFCCASWKRLLKGLFLQQRQLIWKYRTQAMAGWLAALPLHTAMLFLADWCAQAACALQAAKKRRQCYCFWTPRRVGILIEDDKWILSCLMNVTITARKCIKDTTRSLLNSFLLGFVI